VLACKGDRAETPLVAQQGWMKYQQEVICWMIGIRHFPCAVHDAARAGYT
jgi:hypothetical protein